MHKLNVDGAALSLTNNAGIGAVIRDKRGEFIAGLAAANIGLSFGQ